MLARSSPIALLIKIRVALFAIPSAKRTSKESDLCAGKTVLRTSVMMERSVPNLSLMDVELDHLSLATIVRSGVCSGTQSAKKASITLHAASAHRTVLLTLAQTSASHAPRNLTEEPQEHLSDAHQDLK